MNDACDPSAVTRPLGSLLLEEGCLSRDQLALALQHKRRHDMKLGQALVALGLVDEATLAATLVRQGRLPCIELVPGLVDAQVARELAREFCNEHRCIPIHRVAGITTVAMDDPDDEPALEDIARALGTPIFAVHAEPVGIEECLSLVHRDGAGTERELEGLLDRAIEEVRLDPHPAETEPFFEEEGLEGPILNLIQSLVGEAHESGADQIHFEPRTERLVVRVRQDGRLSERLTLDRSWARPLTSRLKLMAALDLRERRCAQRGIARVRYNGTPIELVLSTTPARHGEAATMELREPGPEPELDELGLDPVDNARLHALGLEKGGLLLAIGRSGAGRSATLHALLREFARPGSKLIAVEPPHVNTREDVTQIPVSPAHGMTVARGLAAAWDQSADVLLVDELDDPQAARLAARAALSGATVLAGLFAENATQAVTRLLDLELEPLIVAGALQGVLRQRLLPRLCKSCREPVRLSNEVRARFRIGPGRDVFRPAGCDECHETGVVGRVALFELATFDEDLRERLRTGTRGVELREALCTADCTLARRALELATAGETPWREILQLVSGEAA